MAKMTPARIPDSVAIVATTPNEWRRPNRVIGAKSCSRSGLVGCPSGGSGLPFSSTGRLPLRRSCVPHAFPTTCAATQSKQSIDANPPYGPKYRVAAKMAPNSPTTKKRNPNPNCGAGKPLRRSFETLTMRDSPAAQGHPVSKERRERPTSQPLYRFCEERFCEERRVSGNGSDDAESVKFLTWAVGLKQRAMHPTMAP